MVAQGRTPIPKYIYYLKVAVLRAYLYQLGVRHVSLEPIAACTYFATIFFTRSNFSIFFLILFFLDYSENKANNQVGAVKKMLENRFSIENKRFLGHFPIHELPTDMLTVLAAHWSVQDLIAVFSISKVMRDKYKSLDAPSLWKCTARNIFTPMKFSVHENSGTNEWKKLVHSDSRYVNILTIIILLPWNEWHFTFLSKFRVNIG